MFGSIRYGSILRGEHERKLIYMHIQNFQAHKQQIYHVFADDGIHWHIIPLGSVPEFDGLVISAGEDVRATRNIAAPAHHALVRLGKNKFRIL